MYDTKAVASRIKETAKSQGVVIGDMLTACGLSKNALASMNAGSMPKAENLAAIADHLHVSVDYLLGRTDIPTIDEELAGVQFAFDRGIDREIADEVSDLDEAAKQDILNLLRRMKK